MIIFLRGSSGSGKSTYAKTLGCLHLESDMFVIREGEYQWSTGTLKASHDWCYDTFASAALKGMDVCVSNTFSRKWELERYINFCIDNVLEYRIIRCMGNFKNTHNVPESIVQNMKDRFEDIEGEELYYS
jgi:energy-coupling factor transporter ATP-binding protein EcfA2